MEAGAGEKTKANREKPHSKDASSKGPVKKGKSIENPKKVPSGESSSSSDSSSEEEARAPIKSLNKTSDNKKQGVPKKLTEAQQSSSSDSSDSSDEEEDGEKANVAAEKSKLLPPTNVLPKVQVATYQLLEYQTDMRRCRFDTLGKQTSAPLAGGPPPYTGGSRPHGV